jgi:hypothetical protein
MISDPSFIKATGLFIPHSSNNKELVKNSVFQNDNRSDEMWQQISDMAAVLAPLLKAYDLLIDKSSVISSFYEL